MVNRYLQKVAGVKGAVVGSILGAGMGAAVSNKDNAMQGAALGALGGATIGAGLKFGRHRTSAMVMKMPTKPATVMSKPLSKTIIKKAEDMSNNKYLEKIAGMGSLVGGFGRKAAVGAAIGGATGALAAGPDNRLAGAIGGAAAGGVAGSLFGRKPTAVVKSVSPKLLRDQTRTLVPGVTGAGRSPGSSSLANKMKGFTDV